MSDLERVLEHYSSDQDAGHEEPWESITDCMKTLYPLHPAWSWGAERSLYSRRLQDASKRIQAEWGAERYLYSRQLQDANKRIHELEKELQKAREELKALTSGQTVSVPLSAWNKLCAEAAKARPLAEEKPEEFPARALRFSV